MLRGVKTSERARENRLIVSLFVFSLRLLPLEVATVIFDDSATVAGVSMPRAVRPSDIERRPWDV